MLKLTHIYTHSSHPHITMPVQAPQWTEFLLCPICTQTFEETVRRPISLGCGHTVCKMCLNKLHRKACPFDQTAISTDIEQLPVNTALLQLVGGQVRLVPLCVCTLISWQHLYRAFVDASLLWRIIACVCVCVGEVGHFKISFVSCQYVVFCNYGL